jgi:hypothetical protein
MIDNQSNRLPVILEETYHNRRIYTSQVLLLLCLHFRVSSNTIAEVANLHVQILHAIIVSYSLISIL